MDKKKVLIYFSVVVVISLIIWGGYSLFKEDDQPEVEESNPKFIIHLKDLGNTSCKMPETLENIGEEWRLAFSDYIEYEFNASILSCKKSRLYRLNQWCDCELK